MDKLKLGFAPTRRSIFSAPDAVKYRGLTAERLKQLGIEFVDITDINDEGLLYQDEDMYRIAEKFKKEKVDGLFLPHCNFGTEYECARLAKELNVPVLCVPSTNARGGRHAVARYAVRTVCDWKGIAAVWHSVYIYDKLQVK